MNKIQKRKCVNVLKIVIKCVNIVNKREWKMQKGELYLKDPWQINSINNNNNNNNSKD